MREMYLSAMELLDVIGFGKAVAIEGEGDINPIAGLLTVTIPSSLAAAVVTLQHVPSVAPHMLCAVNTATKRSQTTKFTISHELVAAVILYTQEDSSLLGLQFYQHLNATLRARIRDNAKPYFGYLRMLVEALQRLPSHQGFVYRGIAGVDLTDIFPIGEPVRVWEVMSVSMQRRVAEGFASSGNKSQQSLLVIETQCVAVLGTLALYVGEEECLFLPGSAFMATRVERVGPRAVIHLKHRAEDITKIYR
jgi:hypothetical protein